MRTQILLYTLLSATLISTSCSRDNQPDINSGRVALSVTSGIQTRAYADTWDKDDCIGIYMLADATVEEANRKYITAEGGEKGLFAPAVDQAIYFPVDGSTRDFVAYYPYTTIGEDNLYSVDVATQTPQTAIDLMVAKKVTGKSKTAPAVAFVFTHKLVKLDILIRGDGKSVTDNELIDTEVKITNQRTAATYNVVTGGDVITAGAPKDITLITTALKTEGIVLPNLDTKDMLLTFYVPSMNRTFSWAIKDAPLSQKFDSGKKYFYTITISKKEINATSSVVDWELGNSADGDKGNAE